MCQLYVEKGGITNNKLHIRVDGVLIHSNRKMVFMLTIQHMKLSKSSMSLRHSDKKKELENTPNVTKIIAINVHNVQDS